MVQHIFLQLYLNFMHPDSTISYKHSNGYHQVDDTDQLILF